MRLQGIEVHFEKLLLEISGRLGQEKPYKGLSKDVFVILGERSPL